MAKLANFTPPGNWEDFAPGPNRNRLHALWSRSVHEWTERSIAGDPQNPLDANRDFYYNPLTTDLSNALEPGAVIGWTAFPNTILALFPLASPVQHLQYADNGPPGWSNIPGQGSYEPSGPRGYQDEYCEWSVRRRSSDNKITSVMFTCENPEYWTALWLIDPNKVLELYRQLIGPQVQLTDLSTVRQGQQVYNGANKWNSNTTTGAVHLVSGPNTLPAEIFLAAAATIVRTHAGKIVTDKGELIRCSLYGGFDRNSDPTIGSDVNTIIRGGGVKVSLKDPVGLYIQQPNFGNYATPDGTDPNNFWKIVRGTPRANANDPDFVLHAVFEVPEGHDYVVGDIRISGAPIQFGSQIAQTFQIALRGLGVPANVPNQTPRECIGDPMPAAVAAQPAAEVDPEALRAMMEHADLARRSRR
jgi:hypothetical protein